MMKIVLKIMNIWPKRWITTALVVSVILYLTLVPRPLPDNDIDVPGLDKLVHAVMFGGLAGVACIDKGYLGRGRFSCLSVKSQWMIVGVVSVFGGLIEVAQMLMGAGRSGDVLDFVADVTGAVIGTLAGSRCIALWRKQNGGSSC